MRGFLAIIVSLLSFSVTAQQYVFMQWGTDDGLPISTINDITEDPLGFIWLATDGAGLVRFDGNNFSQPIHPDSLPSPFVTVLESDANGHFWIGTERGPSHYNGRELSDYEVPSELRTRINAIVPVSETEVYIASRAGLYFFDGESFSALPGTEDQEVNSLAVHFQEGLHNRLVYTTSQGITGDLDVDESILGPKESINRVLGYNGDWLTVSDSGVYADQAKGRISSLSGIRDALVIDGNYWLADAQSGIEIVTPNGSMRLSNQNGLAFDRVRSLYMAKNGSIWMGSISGLSKLSSRFLSIYTQNQGLPDERIQATIVDSKGSIWAGTATGLSRINSSGITNYDKNNGLPMGLVLSVSEDEGGRIWVGTEEGLARFDGDQFVKLNMGDPFVFALQPYNGDMYIGTAAGLYSYGNGQMNSIPGMGGFVQLHNDGQTLFGVALDGQLINLSGGQPEAIKRIYDLDLDTLLVRQVAGKAGDFMTVLIEGVGIYVCQDGSCNLINQENGLESGIIKAIASDRSGVWLGTDRGLHYAEIKDGQAVTMRQFDDKNGFLAKECNDRSLVLSADGKLIIGTNSGLYQIDAEPFRAPQENQVYITGIDLFFNPQTDWSEIADTVSPWGNVPTSVRLAADQNYLTFRFASPAGLQAPSYIRYTLEGQDKSWTPISGRNEAVYTDINPGNYTFIVEQSGTSDFLEVASDRIPITIVPPFYQTWWFWTILVVALGAIVFFIVQYRINQLNARLTLESALADSERKALRLQMNPHFVFNALDAISGFIFKNEPKEAVHYLTSFAKLMRLTLDNSRETRVPLKNEIQLLSNYIELEQLRFGKQFTYSIELDDDIDEYEECVPPMLIQPFVENAILHGLRHKTDGRGELKLTFGLGDDFLRCTITDNGVGREKSRELNTKRGKSSLATSITQERVDLLSQSLGKPVRFEINDLYKDTGSASGTEVIITFPQLASDEDA